MYVCVWKQINDVYLLYATIFTFLDTPSLKPQTNIEAVMLHTHTGKRYAFRTSENSTLARIAVTQSVS